MGAVLRHLAHVRARGRGDRRGPGRERGREPPDRDFNTLYLPLTRRPQLRRGLLDGRGAGGHILHHPDGDRVLEKENRRELTRTTYSRKPKGGPGRYISDLTGT